MGRCGGNRGRALARDTRTPGHRGPGAANFAEGTNRGIGESERGSTVFFPRHARSRCTCTRVPRFLGVQTPPPSDVQVRFGHAPRGAQITCSGESLEMRCRVGRLGTACRDGADYGRSGTQLVRVRSAFGMRSALIISRVASLPRTKDVRRVAAMANRREMLFPSSPYLVCTLATPRCRATARAEAHQPRTDVRAVRSMGRPSRIRRGRGSIAGPGKPMIEGR